MTRALLLFTLVSCGPARLGGDYTVDANSTLTHEVLEQALAAAIEAGSWTTDPRLHHQDGHALDGYTIFSEETFSFTLGDRQVLGWTTCATRTMVIGTPANEDWSNSALVHEIFHVMQNCQDTHPVDENADAAHGNWWRDSIYHSIVRARDLW